MTFGLREHGIVSLVLDIEGTTTPSAFVYDVLFPFARTHLRPYLQEHLGTEPLQESIRRLRSEWAEECARGEPVPEWRDSDAEGTIASVAAWVEWLMERDRKSPALKLLQGQIWEVGYRTGALQGEVFPDVPPALARWRGHGVDIAIYSSGSVLAQKLLFGTTKYGDLTRFISAFFDTAAGAKTSPDSYRHIADVMRCPIERLLFISDAAGELGAAASAGCQVVLCVRPGKRPEQAAGSVVHHFDEISG